MYDMEDKGTLGRGGGWWGWQGTQERIWWADMAKVHGIAE